MDHLNLIAVKKQGSLTIFMKAQKKVEDQYQTEGSSHNNGKPLTTDKNQFETVPKNFFCTGY